MTQAELVAFSAGGIVLTIAVAFAAYLLLFIHQFLNS
jgi:hypothetical protein